MVTLTKSERWELKQAYSCRCAYCGTKLGDKWHADHVKPVQREGKWVREAGHYRHVMTGVLNRPERDNKDNLMPACVPCNIDKHDFSLESWRKHLEQSAAVLTANYSRYRHALRFNLIVEQAPRVVFFFERMHQPERRVC